MNDSIANKKKLTRENTPKNLQVCEFAEAAYSFKLIRLAKLAMGVPNPPISTPRSRA